MVFKCEGLSILTAFWLQMIILYDHTINLMVVLSQVLLQLIRTYSHYLLIRSLRRGSSKACFGEFSVFCNTSYWDIRAMGAFRQFPQLLPTDSPFKAISEKKQNIVHFNSIKQDSNLYVKIFSMFRFSEVRPTEAATQKCSQEKVF